MSDLNHPLTNGQIELMKLFAMNLSDDELNQLRTILVRFIAERPIKRADEIWDNNGLTDNDMDRLLHSPS